jgi:hypothetical protein
MYVLSGTMLVAIPPPPPPKMALVIDRTITKQIGTLTVVSGSSMAM